LVWHEQVRESDSIAFRPHTILGEEAAHNRYGVVFSELHSVNLADMDGDGLKDIITGKTYWSHHTKSPLWDAGAVVYWFRLVRRPDGVDWVPYKADGEAGIGRQLIVHDINRDGLPDIAAGGMKGAHVLIHRTQAVTAERWQESQPLVQNPTVKSYSISPLPADRAATRVAGAIEAETMQIISASAGSARTQAMGAFRGGQWSGNEQLFWSGAMPGDRLEVKLSVEREGQYRILGVLTKARDYGIVQLQLDDERLGEAIDLFNAPAVIATGEIDLGRRRLTAGDHRLTIIIQGANRAAVKSYMFGLDYLRLVAD